MNPIDFFVWTFVAVFIITAIFTVLGTLNNARIIQVNDKYLKALYAALLLEIIVAGVCIATGKLDSIIERRGSEIVVDIQPKKGVKSAGTLVLTCHNDKPAMLMVMHEKKGRIVFSPPAGKSKKNESPMETAIRETIEETGFFVIGKEIIGNSPAGNTNFYLVLAELDSSRLSRSHFQEVIGAIWINPTEIPLSSWRFPEQKEWIIEKFVEYATNDCN